MNLNFEVKRKRFSVTQGEAEVLVNGQTVVQYYDNIVLNGEHEQFGGFGSTYSDDYFIAAGMREYASKITKIGGTHKCQ